jgi:hypothetical protein
MTLQKRQLSTSENVEEAETRSGLLNFARSILRIWKKGKRVIRV